MTAAGHDIGDRLIALLPNMRRFALSLSRRPDLADDLVQQAGLPVRRGPGDEPTPRSARP